MIVVLFSTTLRDEALREEYDELNRSTQALAAAIPGFVGWEEFETADGGTLGIVRFEDETALSAWRDDPVHQRAHRRGVEAVYGSYRVEILQRVRGAGFTWDRSTA